MTSNNPVYFAHKHNGAAHEFQTAKQIKKIHGSGTDEYPYLKNHGRFRDIQGIFCPESIVPLRYGNNELNTMSGRVFFILVFGSSRELFVPNYEFKFVDFWHSTPQQQCSP